MRRRDFIAVLGGAATWPLAARAQAALPVIGFFSGGFAAAYTAQVPAFGLGLKESGYVEGENVAIEYLWANEKIDRLPALAAHFIRQRVAVIAGAGATAALAAKAATTTIPVVFETAGDPVKLGLVASLNRPGSNVTGVTQLSSELVAKRVGLLHELLPTAKIVGLVVNPADPRAETQSREIEAAARALGLEVVVLKAGTTAEIDAAFAGMIKRGADALMFGTGTLFSSAREELAAMATRHRIPVIYHYREFVAAGGLMSYGASLTDSYRLAGIYTGRVLKGEKPADLPIVQSNKFELAINLKAAKALGLDISPNLLAQADEVIE